MARLAHLSAGEGGAELVRRADTALYAAKHAGRDRLVMASSEESASAAESHTV
jgi:PleD family two-component response regulator